MSNVHDIREAASIERQASEWLALLTSGDASAADRARYDAWIREHPSHKAAFDQISHTMDRVRLASEQLRETIPTDLDVNARVENFAVPEATVRWRKYLPPAAAAAVIVVAIASMLLYPFDNNAVHRTEVGQQITVKLPDQSTVELNTDTALQVRYSDHARMIELRRGEAFFDVAPDSVRPFVVQAGPGAVRAIGTSFVVRVQNQAVKVTVTEGVIEIIHDAIDHNAVSSPGIHTTARPPATSPAQLSEGQRVKYDQHIVTVAKVEPADLDREFAWRQGLLIFDGQSLDEVIREVGRYTDTRIIIRDADLRALRVGGAYQAGDIEAVLEFFEEGLNVSVNRDEPGTIYLTAAPGGNGL